MYTSDNRCKLRKKVVTNLAVLDVTKNGFQLLERAPGVSIEEIVKASEAELIINGEVPEMKLTV